MTKYSISLKINIDKHSITIIQTLLKHNYEAYLVGGCVRDFLLGLKPKDIDIVTNARPENIKSIFKNCRLVGKRFLLAHIILPNRKFIEVATFRGGDAQVYQNDKIKRGNVYGTIEEDAVRRDLTINSLYYDIKRNKIIDFVGGIKDIKNKQLKIIGNSEQRYIEDPVRMIRVIRFKNKLNFDIYDTDLKNIKKQANLLRTVPPARLLDEVIKLFHNENAISTFQELHKTKLLKYLFPNTKYDDFIAVSLTNTQDRIKQNKSLNPSFLFSVFLWLIFLENFKKINNKNNDKILSHKLAVEFVIKEQTKFVMIPKWLSEQMSDIWLLQHKLEQITDKKKSIKVINIMQNKRFRAAYDFLLLRSMSIDCELKKIANFWTRMQI